MGDPIDPYEQMIRTRELLERIQWQTASQQNPTLILKQISIDNYHKALEADAIAKIDKKLAETEKEYMEAIKAQEIMDQIDESRK